MFSDQTHHQHQIRRGECFQDLCQQLHAMEHLAYCSLLHSQDELWYTLPSLCLPESPISTIINSFLAFQTARSTTLCNSIKFKMRILFLINSSVFTFGVTM